MEGRADDNRRILPSTARLYMGTAMRLEESGKEPVVWFREQARDPELAKKTASVLRSAVAHYMVWKDLVSDRHLALAQLGGVGHGRGEKRREALSEEEVEIFIEIVCGKVLPDGSRDITSGLKQPIPAILQLLLYTGMRVSEGCSLTLNDITLTGRRPRIEVQRGKGNNPRTIELGHDAVAVLREHLRTEPEGGKGPGGLFPWLYSHPGGALGSIPDDAKKPLQPYVIRRELEAALSINKEEIGEASPHILRHTFATDMLDAGGTLKHIQAVLGHKNLNVLERYLTIRPEQMKLVLDKMPQRIKDGP